MNCAHWSPVIWILIGLFHCFASDLGAEAESVSGRDFRDVCPWPLSSSTTVGFIAVNALVVFGSDSSINTLAMATVLCARLPVESCEWPAQRFLLNIYILITYLIIAWQFLPRHHCRQQRLQPLALTGPHRVSHPRLSLTAALLSLYSLTSTNHDGHSVRFFHWHLPDSCPSDMPAYRHGPRNWTNMLQ